MASSLRDVEKGQELERCFAKRNQTRGPGVCTTKRCVVACTSRKISLMWKNTFSSGVGHQGWLHVDRVEHEFLHFLAAQVRVQTVGRHDDVAH
jgi:hypothetical protein